MSPLVVIVGQTGSGKTALGIELAKRYNGEIISADSRTVYQGMDIGTAKPTPAEREGIPHYGFDVVAPNESFSVYDFQQLSFRTIEDIAGRGKLPIMVGGTGLYIDAVIYGFRLRARPAESQRARLQGLSVDELRERVVASGLPLPQNDRNPRHLMRLLESGLAPNQVKILRPKTLVMGLMVPREQLLPRIEARVDAMLEAGLLDEVRGLRSKYGSIEALRAPGYKAFGAYLDGEIDLAEARRQFVRNDMRLAKRQRTWFKRNPDIHWLELANKLVQAETLVSELFAS